MCMYVDLFGFFIKIFTLSLLLNLETGAIIATEDLICNTITTKSLLPVNSIVGSFATKTRVWREF